MTKLERLKELCDENRCDYVGSSLADQLRPLLDLVGQMGAVLLVIKPYVSTDHDTVNIPLNQALAALEKWENA